MVVGWKHLLYEHTTVAHPPSQQQEGRQRKSVLLDYSSEWLLMKNGGRLCSVGEWQPPHTVAFATEEDPLGPEVCVVFIGMYE